MNVAMPLQIGARDVSFPFLNSLGLWLFIFGGILLNLSWFLGGAPTAGWTSYASLAVNTPGHGIDFYVSGLQVAGAGTLMGDRKSTRLNSSHVAISYAVFCLKKKQ